MAKADKPDDGHVLWINRGWQPAFIGFCPSKRAWKREMKRLGNEAEPYPKESGRCTTFKHEGALVILITVKDGTEANRCEQEIFGLLVHECTHAWQFVRRNMGETDPSDEFEAYAMQAIFQGVHAAWHQSRGPCCK